MKKTLKIVLLVAVLVLCLATNVKAATNEELIEYATKKFDVNGAQVGLTTANAQKVRRFLQENPVSEADADAIIAKIDAGVEILRNAGVTDPEKLSADQRSQILALGQEAAKIAGAELTYSDGAITIYKDGEVWDQATVSDALVQTGNDTSYVVVVGASLAIIAVVGLAVYVVKKSNV